MNYFSAHRPLGHMVLRNLQTCSSLDFGTASKDYKAGNLLNPQAHACATHTKTAANAQGLPTRQSIGNTVSTHSDTEQRLSPQPGSKGRDPKEHTPVVLHRHSQCPGRDATRSLLGN